MYKYCFTHNQALWIFIAFTLFGLGTQISGKTSLPAQAGWEPVLMSGSSNFTIHYIITGSTTSGLFCLLCVEIFLASLKFKAK